MFSSPDTNRATFYMCSIFSFYFAPPNKRFFPPLHEHTAKLRTCATYVVFVLCSSFQVNFMKLHINNQCLELRCGSALTFNRHGAAHGDLRGLALSFPLLPAPPLIHGDESQARQPLPLHLDVISDVNLR